MSILSSVKRLSVAEIDNVGTVFVAKASNEEGKKSEEQRIAISSLERYTGSKLEDFQSLVLITNFPDYLKLFDFQFCGNGVMRGSSWGCVHSEKNGVSIINYNMGSPNAALVMDILSRIPLFDAVLFIGMVGALPNIGDEAKIGDYFLPYGAVRSDGVSSFYVNKNVPALPNLEMVSELDSFLKDKKSTFHRGVVYTMNIRFWEFNEDFKKELMQSTAEAIDMETATVFCVSRKNKMKAAALHLMSDMPFEAAKDAALAHKVKTEFAPKHIKLAMSYLKTMMDTD